MNPGLSILAAVNSASLDLLQPVLSPFQVNLEGACACSVLTGVAMYEILPV